MPQRMTKAELAASDKAIECRKILDDFLYKVSDGKFHFGDTVFFHEFVRKPEGCSKCGWTGRIQALYDNDTMITARCPFCEDTQISRSFYRVSSGTISQLQAYSRIPGVLPNVEIGLGCEGDSVTCALNSIYTTEAEAYDAVYNQNRSIGWSKDALEAFKPKMKCESKNNG